MLFADSDPVPDLEQDFPGRGLEPAGRARGGWRREDGGRRTEEGGRRISGWAGCREMSIDGGGGRIPGGNFLALRCVYLSEANGCWPARRLGDGDREGGFAIGGGMRGGWRGRGGCAPRCASSSSRRRLSARWRRSSGSQLSSWSVSLRCRPRTENCRASTTIGARMIAMRAQKARICHPMIVALGDPIPGGRGTGEKARQRCKS